MARLKFHPRDALPNTTALARAERLFVELAGEERAVLGQAMNEFRATLEGQNAAEIEAARSQLVTWVDRLGTGR